MNKIILLFAVLFINYTYGQKTEIYLKIGDEGIKEYSLNRGFYRIKFDHTYDSEDVKYYQARVTITSEPIPPFQVEKNDPPFVSEDKTTLKGFKEFIEVNIKPRTKVEIEVLEFLVKDNEIKTYTYILKGIPERKWVTSFGLAGAYLVQSQTYKTVAENGAFRITPDGDQNIVDAIPVVQFSYIRLDRDNYFSWTGGLGYDSENLAVFAGGSVYVGHNLILTAGAALHKQRRRSNNFSNNQIVPAALEFDVLNEQYYRVNPFVSLTFVMNNNIFKN